MSPQEQGFPTSLDPRQNQGQPEPEIGPRAVVPPKNPQEVVLRRNGTNIIVPYSADIEMYRRDHTRMAVKDAIAEGLLGRSEPVRVDPEKAVLQERNAALQREVEQLRKQQAAAPVDDVSVSAMPPLPAPEEPKPVSGVDGVLAAVQLPPKE